MAHFNSKHSHLREPVMTYFLTHTWEETRVRFKLTESNLKSLFTVGYCDPKLAHLRKDTRRKDPWTLKEMLFLLQHAGVRDRNWIAKKLNRAGQRNIKERMQKWNAATKFLNGMPRKWAVELWGQYAVMPPGIKTKAGPTGGVNTGDFRFVIIPWHEAERLSKTYRTPPKLKACIRAMMRFQEFIHGTKSPAWIRRKLKQAVAQK